METRMLQAASAVCLAFVFHWQIGESLPMITCSEETIVGGEVVAMTAIKINQKQKNASQLAFILLATAAPT